MQSRSTMIIIAVILLLLAGVYLLGVNKKSASPTSLLTPTSVISSPTNAPSPTETATNSATPQTTTIPTTSTEITLSAIGFSPTTLTIKKGQSVTWVNKSGTDATVNSNPHPVHTDYPPLNLGSFPSGGTLSLTFPTAGTFGYHNHLNPSEKGTIIVK